jgi:hypothetical protein
MEVLGFAHRKLLGLLDHVCGCPCCPIRWRCGEIPSRTPQKQESIHKKQSDPFHSGLLGQRLFSSPAVFAGKTISALRTVGVKRVLVNQFLTFMCPRNGFTPEKT